MKRISVKHTLIGAAAIISFCSTSQAQVVAQANIERTLQEQQLDLQRVNAAVESSATAPLTREVTYAELLADPGNVELNILYARTQINRGHLDKAQAALERVLLQYPEITYVRMLYGLVLYRLGNFTDAESVLTELLNQDLSPSEKSKVQQYLDNIALQRKDTRYTLNLGFGGHYDSNRNAEPASNTISLLGISLPTGGKEEDDFGALYNVSLEVRHDPGFQRPHELYARGTVVMDEQTALGDYSLFMGRADIGSTLSFDIGKIDLSLNASTITLGRSHYMNTTGFNARWDAHQGEEYTPYATYSATLQNFDGQGGVSAARERNGLQHAASVGGKMALAANGLTDIGVSYTKKGANQKYNAYSGYGINLSHTQVFDMGRFILGQASYNIDTYDQADLFISSKKRRDNRARLGVTGGIPLGSIATDYTLPEGINDVMLTATLERSMNRSNISNYEFNNWRSQLMLSKTISF